MGFDLTKGYLPETFDAKMERVLDSYNSQTNQTLSYEEFKGTNMYLVAVGLVDEMLAVENSITTIFDEYREYIKTQNEILNNSKGVIGEFLKDCLEQNLEVALDTTVSGTLKVALLENLFTDIGTLGELIKDNLFGGNTTAGSETYNTSLPNGQTLAIKYSLATATAKNARLTISKSTNSLAEIPTDDEIIQIFLDNVAERYALGNDFEPPRYLTLCDLPFAREILVEYSDGSGGWTSDPFVSAFDQKLTFDAGDVDVIIS